MLLQALLVMALLVVLGTYQVLAVAGVVQVQVLAVVAVAEK
jgi:hypothetical protein